MTSGSVNLHLNALKFLVLDEADRLLDTTIGPDLDIILSRMPPPGTGRQTLLFSATISKNVSRAEELATASTFKWSATAAVRMCCAVSCIGMRYVSCPRGCVAVRVV